MDFSRRDFMRDLSTAGAFAVLASRATWGQKVTNSMPGQGAPSAEALHSLNPVPIEQVVIEDEFWSPKRKVWQEVTLRDCLRKFESDRGGAFSNFDKVRDGRRKGHAGPPWTDGLVYEMIRGASDFLIAHPDPELEQLLDGYVERIVAAAEKDPRGYVNTYTQLEEPGHDWGLNGGLQLWQHEIYNLGALIDASIHYYRATGKTTLLTAGVKIANYMYDFMGPEPKKNIVPCHPLPEEALIRLYELFQEQPSLKEKLSLPVNEQHYLSLAEFWIEDRGNNIGQPDWEKNHRAAEEYVRNQEYGNGRPSWGTYAQDDVPVFEQKVIEGHAVRATLLCAGISAAARVNKDERYCETAVRLWQNMVYQRMHITGGVGAFAEEEKFGPDYTLPNNAYLETCAAVGAGFFHRNMNLAFGHARYVDELERTLYNGALAGVSLKGDTYFYQNPLEADTTRTRWIWNDCPCCPPMFVKLMGAMPGYIYATDGDSVYVNLFVSSRANAVINNEKVVLRQTTRYPWDENVKIAIEAAPSGSMKLMLRVPGWCRGESLTVNGKRVATDQRVRGYVQIDRVWKQGDVVELTLPMPVEQIHASPEVQADAGRVAITRGPIVYCLESADNGDETRNLAVKGATFSAESRPDFLGGVVVVNGTAVAGSSESSSIRDLYRPTELTSSTSVQITAIPYFANANRGPVEMTVWLPIET